MYTGVPEGLEQLTDRTILGTGQLGTRIASWKQISYTPSFEHIVV